MRTLILLGLVLGAVAVGTPGLVGQSGGGGGGGGGGAFTDCVACKNIVWGIWHCDGEGDEEVAVNEFHACPYIWPGSCHSNHPDPCGLLAFSEFDADHWTRGVLDGVTQYGVCGMGRSIGAVA